MTRIRFSDDLLKFRNQNNCQTKKISVCSINSGINTPTDHIIYPKKVGIGTPRCSAIALTIKFGALPI